MATKRDSYSDNEHSILYAETGGCCPLCTLPIFFQKKGSKKPSKGYEVAHIYPLNPTQSQATALVAYPVPLDVNALENVIALCPTCHTKYDKDFKLDELIRLEKIKDGYLSEARAKLTASPGVRLVVASKNLTLRCGGNSGNTLFRSIYRAGVIQGIFSWQAVGEVGRDRFERQLSYGKKLDEKKRIWLRRITCERETAARLDA